MLTRQATVVTALLLLTATSRARAQDSITTRGHYLLGAGATLSPGTPAGLAIQLGREWSAPASRFALRLTGDFTRTQASNLVYPGYFIGGASGSASHRTQELDLGLGGTYTLHRGRIQPYLISGFLLQYRDLRQQYEADPLVPQFPGGAPNASFDYRERGLGIGFQGGLGLSVDVGASALFVESRTFVPVGGLRPGRSTPLTFGLRF